MGELAAERLVGGAAHAAFRDEKARRRRDDQRRHLGDEPVAAGQQRVGLDRVGEAQVLLGDADDDAADDVDEGDEQRRDGVAAHEFRGAVHGAEEGRLVLELLAPFLRLLLVDEAGREIGVDRHLLARHGVEREARRDLGDAPRALRDDDEIHDDEDREDDDADDEVAAHDEAPEGLDDVAGGRGSLVAVGEDEAGRGEVQRQPQHRRDEQERREDRELERVLDEQRGHQDQHRNDDRDGEQEIEEDRGEGHDEHHEDAHHPDGEEEVGALGERAQRPELRRHHEAAGPAA